MHLKFEEFNITNMYDTYSYMQPLIDQGTQDAFAWPWSSKKYDSTKSEKLNFLLNQGSPKFKPIIFADNGSKEQRKMKILDES